MDITSANATLVIGSQDFGLVATQLEGFWIDSGFSFQGVEVAVAQKGVDGKLSAGWVPSIKPMNINFSPDSPSIRALEGIVEAQDANRTIYRLNGTITIPATGHAYSLSDGVVTNAQKIPSQERILGSQQYTITWGEIRPSIIQ